MGHLPYPELTEAMPWKPESESHSVLSLCNAKDSTVHGILQARILEWAVFPFSEGFSQPRDQT